jgi:hypothetical protein
MLRKVLLFTFVSFSFYSARCQTTASVAQKTSLEALKFLVGSWVGEGSAETGPAGEGSCSFERKLQDQVLLRSNHAEYPATKDHAAIKHDDLMIIYPDRGKHLLRAFYTDNEGHVINYTVSVPDNGPSAVFLGDAEAGQQRFRLSYTLIAPGRMTINLEMAPPDQPNQFQRLIAGKLHRSAEKN